MNQPAPVTHRAVLAIAVPIMLSNVTEPLIGVVDTAIIGRLPEAYYIGAVSLGALIFGFIYWGFGFLRMGTGGLSAQAKGAGDAGELDAVLIRALMIAGVCGIALVALSPLIGRLAFSLLEGSPDVEFHAWQYFTIRVWSAPFALANYCIMGWFIGQGRAKTAFVIQVWLNGANALLDIFFVLHLGMTSDGVAYGTLIAEVSAALLGLAIASGAIRRFNAARVFDAAKIWRTLAINRDIMIRTLCLVFAFSWFTAQGAKAGDVLLAANIVLLHFFDVAAFLIDGFAFASEALVGQAIGAKDRPRFETSLKITWIWIMAAGALCAAIIIIGGPFFLDAMTVNGDIRALARGFLWWAAFAPFIGAVCFQYDGIYSGATQTADMRNMMIISLALYLAAWWLLKPFGNHGLWAALNIFFVARGLTFAARMSALRRSAFAQPA